MRLEHVQFQLFSIMVLHINAIGITFVVMKVNAEIMDLLLLLGPLRKELNVCCS